MKKIVVFILSAILSALACMCFVACENDRKYAIDDYTWVMSSVQSVEQNGAFVAYAPSNEAFDKGAYPNAVSIDMTCNAQDGVLTILNETNNTTYCGTYTVSDRSSQTMIYEIAVEGKSGMAVVSATSAQDGTVFPTMILSVGDYALNFHSK